MRSERLFVLASFVALLDTLYLTWRYLALHAGWVRPGTGLCSLRQRALLWFPRGVDCDPVLLSREARALYVPNATLGLGFFLGCFVFYLLARREGAHVRRAMWGLLALMLSIGSLFTVVLFSLLVRLPTLCPFCPWNHVWTYLLLGASITAFRASPKTPWPWKSLVLPSAIAVGQFVLWQCLWAIPFAMGLLTP